MPLSHEAFGRMGVPARALLCQLGDAVEAPGLVSKSSFVSGACTELSVALCKGQHKVFRAFAFNLAKVAGALFAPGDLVPSV